MTSFTIKYNPYVVQCEFEKNGIPVEAGKLTSKKGSRLQYILGASKNWEGLFEEIASTCDDEKINLIFKGRTVDFDDLMYAHKLYDGDVDFNINFIELEDDANVFAKIKKLIDRLKSLELPEFEERNADGKNLYENYKYQTENETFEVSVIATMSSGKSTLINSLLHTELLPSENQACTATICTISDNDSMEAFEAECFGHDGEVVFERCIVSKESMKEYNANENVTEIHLEGNIPATSAEKIHLCLIDTPGPNNSRNENHGIITEEIIEDPRAVVLYVINATQIGINDDFYLLSNISAEMKKHGKQSRDRFIFVVNKCDMLDEEKEPVDKVLKDVREYLGTFGIEDPILIPTSAYLALLIRKSLNEEELSRKEKKDLAQVEDFVESNLLHFEKYATMTPTVEKIINNQIVECKENEELGEEALIHTGIPVLEGTISEYVNKYAFPMKINDATKPIRDSIRKSISLMELYERSAEDSSVLKNLRKQIKDNRQKKDKLANIKKEFEEKIDRIQLDVLLLFNTKREVEKELGKCTKDYQGEVTASQAKLMVKNFYQSVSKICEAFLKRLNQDIKNDTFAQCENIQEEYVASVEKILEEMKITNFAFEGLPVLQSVELDDKVQKNIMEKNTRTKKETRTRTIANPEKAGFWGKLKFWKPDEIEENYEASIGEFTNMTAVMIEMMSPIQYQVKKDIEEVFAMGEKQIQGYKDGFRQNLDKLEEEIAKVMNEIEKTTDDEKDLKDQVKKRAKSLKELKLIQSEMDELLGM